MLLTLETIAERLHYTGSDRERSVRRLFAQHRVPIIRRGRSAHFVTEQQYAALLEALTTCSHSEGAVQNSTSVARSVSGARRATSQSTLRAAIAEMVPKPTDRTSKPRSA